MRQHAAELPSEMGQLLRAHPASAGESREMPRLLLSFADLFSVEASFVLFLFAGRYKNLPELRGFPIDFTLLFLTATFCLVAWAVVSGRMRPIPLSSPVLLMISFSAFAVASLFWSSMDQRNVEKLTHFLLLASPSFFVAHLSAQDKPRRERLLRWLLWFSAAILMYYVYYRWILGINLADKQGEDYANNYIEYNSHANIVFILFVSLAVFGSPPPKQLAIAIVGACAALFALLTIGGRGPLALALLAIPFLAIGLLLRARGGLPRLARLLGHACAVTGVAVLGYMVLVQSEGSSAAWEELRTLDRFEMQLSHESTDSMDVRLEAQEYAFEKWLEQPVTGWGFGEFRIHSDLDYPHNLLLEILMEMGLVGAFLFFSVCAVAIIDCVRMARDGTSNFVDATIALLFLTQLVSHLTVQGYLGDDRIFLAFIGLAIGSRSGALEQIQSVRPRKIARQSSSAGED